MTQEPMEAALADFRRLAEVSLARIEGQLALLLQRQDQIDRRADGMEARQREQDARLDAVERTQVTKADMDQRASRTIGWSAVIVTVIGIVTGSGTSIAIAAMSK